MSSERYKVIMALLDDPLSQACLLREFQRRDLGLIQLLPPPVRTGEKWVFPTMKFAMRELMPDGERQKTWVNETVFEIYEGESGWLVMNVAEDVEVGPFPSPTVALKEAEELAVQEGYTLLERMPWTNEDVANWPLKA